MKIIVGKTHIELFPFQEKLRSALLATDGEYEAMRKKYELLQERINIFPISSDMVFDSEIALEYLRAIHPEPIYKLHVAHCYAGDDGDMGVDGVMYLNVHDACVKFISLSSPILFEMQRLIEEEKLSKIKEECRAERKRRKNEKDDKYADGSFKVVKRVRA